jgi:hypothetical protein
MNVDYSRLAQVWRQPLLEEALVSRPIATTEHTNYHYYY